MAMFEYEALTGDGRLMKGAVEAAGLDEVRARLAGMQLTVQSVTKASPSKPRTTIGRNEFILFNQQLGSLAKAGVPLDRGLRELSADVQSPRMRTLLNEIAADLERGSSIDDAFARHQSSMPPMYVHILQAGVRSGRLG